MECRPGCAACCTKISISSALPGHPEGKPAGTVCANLDKNWRCRLWNTPAYPLVCQQFTADPAYCGRSNKEAHEILERMEKATSKRC